MKRIDRQGVIAGRGNGIIGFFRDDRIGRGGVHNLAVDIGGCPVPGTAQRMAGSPFITIMFLVGGAQQTEGKGRMVRTCYFSYCQETHTKKDISGDCPGFCQRR